MRYFYNYDLKKGTGQPRRIYKEVVRQELEEANCDKKEAKKSFRILAMILKTALPVICSIVIYWFVCERLYEIRGYRAMGSEFLIPPMIWYLLYRILDYLF